MTSQYVKGHYLLLTTPSVLKFTAGEMYSILVKMPLNIDGMQLFTSQE